MTTALKIDTRHLRCLLDLYRSTLDEENPYRRGRESEDGAKRLQLLESFIRTSAAQLRALQGMEPVSDTECAEVEDAMRLVCEFLEWAQTQLKPARG